MEHDKVSTITSDVKHNILKNNDNAKMSKCNTTEQ